MQLHNTILALQIMNGVKVYAVKFLSDGRSASGKIRHPGLAYDDDDPDTYRPALSSKRYQYKSAIEIEPGRWVLVPTQEGKRFAIAKVIEEVVDVDFDSDVRMLWINQTIEPPYEVYNANAEHDAKARRKLAASQAHKAAQEHLAALGVDLSAFAVTDQRKEAMGAREAALQAQTAAEVKGLAKAAQDGAHAARSGLGVAVNPYPLHSAAHDAFVEAWNDAAKRKQAEADAKAPDASFDDDDDGEE